MTATGNAPEVLAGGGGDVESSGIHCLVEEVKVQSTVLQYETKQCMSGLCAVARVHGARVHMQDLWLRCTRWPAWSLRGWESREEEDGVLI